MPGSNCTPSLATDMISLVSFPTSPWFVPKIVGVGFRIQFTKDTWSALRLAGSVTSGEP